MPTQVPPVAPCTEFAVVGVVFVVVVARELGRVLALFPVRISGTISGWHIASWCRAEALTMGVLATGGTDDRDADGLERDDECPECCC